MLLEIRCDKFLDHGKVRPPIFFHPGLNVVLGNKYGTNSIGKSTFLLIVDFVFGGDDYPKKAVDVLRNIDEHTICFVFEFNGSKYYFSRSTAKFQEVAICNENFQTTQTIKIEEFRNWLREQYGITQEDLSFRNVVSRFFRIYQRENLNEKRPLDFVHQTKESDVIVDLEKLFDRYGPIKQTKQILEQSQKEKEAYTAAEEVKLIPIVHNQNEFAEQQNLLQQLRVEQQQYDDLSKIEGKSSDDLLKVSSIRGELQRLRCQKSRLMTKKKRIESQLDASKPTFEDDFRELISFFPTINLSLVKQIESFHSKLSSILHDELQQELDKVNAEIPLLIDKIRELEGDLQSFDIPNNISLKVLKDYAALEGQIKEIEKQLENYTTLKNLKKAVSEYKEKHVEICKPILREIESAINHQMQEYDSFIYNGTKEPPVFSLSPEKYDFETKDDTGTGTSFKSLIVFDLTILKLTNLPALIHDSLILRNIGDDPIAKILELYNSFSDKQIFIAFDKPASYNNQATEQILRENAVLLLSDNESSLFGRCWSKKIKKTGTDAPQERETNEN